jgi:hypothetical protein
VVQSLTQLVLLDFTLTENRRQIHFTRRNRSTKRSAQQVEPDEQGY